MTLSYHVSAVDDIKCYLLWQGCSQRFYPQDIVEVLPKFFVCDDRDKFGNKAFAESVEIKRLVSNMKIEDTKFEEFHRSINRLSQEKFPRQFDIPSQEFHGQAIVSNQNATINGDKKESNTAEEIVLVLKAKQSTVKPKADIETIAQVVHDNNVAIDKSYQQMNFPRKIPKILKQELEEIVNTYYDNCHSQCNSCSPSSLMLSGM